MEKFRVYTNVNRVGVEFRFMQHTRLQLPSATLMFVIAVAFVGLALLASLVVHSLTLTIIPAVIGALLEMGVLFAALQLTRINSATGRRGPSLRETTMVRLLWDNIGRPVKVNFDTPDERGGPIKRNF